MFFVFFVLLLLLPKILGLPTNERWHLTYVDEFNDDVDLDRNVDAGFGVSVYVMDTGLYGSHREFENMSWINNDDVGHGTHVSSTIAGMTVGVSPGAKLVPHKFIGSDGQGSGQDLVDQLNEIWERGKRGVINLSINGGLFLPLNRLIRDMTDSGKFLFVCAAGNSADDACKTSPGAESSCLTVGCLDYEGEVCDFSNFGSCVDLYAPGDPIFGAWNSGPNDYVWDSGTSMSTALVSGVAARYMRKYYDWPSGDVVNRLLAQVQLEEGKIKVPNEIFLVVDGVDVPFVGCSFLFENRSYSSLKDHGAIHVTNDDAESTVLSTDVQVVIQRNNRCCSSIDDFCCMYAPGMPFKWHEILVGESLRPKPPRHDFSFGVKRNPVARPNWSFGKCMSFDVIFKNRRSAFFRVTYLGSSTYFDVYAKGLQHIKRTKRTKVQIRRMKFRSSRFAVTVSSDGEIRIGPRFVLAKNFFPGTGRFQFSGKYATIKNLNPCYDKPKSRNLMEDDNDAEAAAVFFTTA